MALRGGRPASAFHPLPFPGAGRPRKVLAGLVSEGWGPGHRGGPRSRVRGASSSSTESSLGQGLWRRRAEQQTRLAGAGPAVPPGSQPQACRRPPEARWTLDGGQEGERVLCPCGRKGRKEREWIRREGRSGGLLRSPAHTRVTGHRGGWRQTLRATSTDRQTRTLRPPGGLSQPVQ